MLAHAADIDHRIDEKHGHQPSMEQPFRGDGSAKNSDDHGCSCNHLRKDREPVACVAVFESQDGNRDDVHWISGDQAKPVQRKDQPTPAGVICVMIRVAIVTQMQVMAEMQDAPARR